MWDGRHDAALWSSLRSRLKKLVEHHATFQPLIEYLPVDSYVIEKPFMTDMVEASLDVTLQYPLGRTILAQPSVC